MSGRKEEAKEALKMMILIYILTKTSNFTVKILAISKIYTEGYNLCISLLQAG